MYICETSLVEENPCLDNKANQHTCMHTHAGDSLKGVSFG